MEKKLGHPSAGRGHIKILLQRRDYLKKMAFERLLQGKEVGYYYREISAINSVLNELLALRGHGTISTAEADEADEETERGPLEVDTLSAEEAMGMVLRREEYPIQVRDGKRIRFQPTLEVRLARTTSHKMDVITVSLWRAMDETAEWRHMGGFKIPVEAFSAFVQGLSQIRIDPQALEAFDGE
jgi:hypothetical protein